MCQASTQKYTNETLSASTLIGKVWPLHPAVALGSLSLFPSYCFVNRGFTQWFHWASFIYLLTQSKFLQKFQVVTGISICLGWYSALAIDYFKFGRFCVALYKNMPPAMTDIMLDKSTGQLNYDSTSSLLIMLQSHIMDILAHVLLTYYFWCKHRQQGGTFREVCTWPAIILSYLFARSWSMTMVYHNTGKLGFFYIGYDVYVLDVLDPWYAAYFAETVFYLSVILWKVFGEESRSASTTKLTENDESLNNKPNLIIISELSSVSDISAE
jgi:hypothetical protein